MPYLANQRYLLASLALTLFVLAFLVGCSNNQIAETPTITVAPPTPTPLPRGGTLSIRAANDIPDLKPWQPRSRAEEQVIELMYSGLVQLDDTLQPRPDLAERWEVSADGRLITFTLRSNLNWHDGVALTADDVAFTLSALREVTPTTALVNDIRTRIADVTVLATNTVALSLTERYAPILAELAVPILPRHVLNGRNVSTVDFWETPVGSGPFKFEYREPGESVTLVAHALFYRGPPLLDRVVLSIQPDNAQAAQALSEKQLQLAEFPASLSPPITTTATTAQAGEYVENGSYFLGFNTRENRPFADPEVRTALAAALDIPAIVRAATNGVGRPIGSGAAPGSWADFVPPPTSTADFERAQALLDEAGWRIGEESSVRQRNGQTLAGQLFVRSDDPRRIQAAELIAQAAQTIGISITVQAVDFDTVIRAKFVPPYDFDMLLGSWSGGVGDASFGDYLFYDPDDYNLFHSSQINQGTADTRAVLNFVGFTDPAYEAQAIAARQLYDQDARKDAQRQSQQRISDQKPYLYLWSDRTITALEAGITTLDGPVDLDSPLYLWNIERWFITP